MANLHCTVDNIIIIMFNHYIFVCRLCNVYIHEHVPYMIYRYNTLFFIIYIHVYVQKSYMYHQHINLMVLSLSRNSQSKVTRILQNLINTNGRSKKK